MRSAPVMSRFLAVSLLLALRAVPARAQLNGENLLGDMGVQSGTQPRPGFLVSGLYALYTTSTIKDADGNSVTISPGQPGSQTIHVLATVINYVTPVRVLGAQYGMMAVLPFGNGSLEAPALGLDENVSWGAADVYVVPMQLGWHFRRADVLAGLGFFAPTGRYTAGASDNLGKGMWSYELSAGTTVYLDPHRSLSLAATGFWEFHSKKDGAVTVGTLTLSDVTVGQLLTVEGGLAKSFLAGAAHVGVAYYAQWKVTDDDLGSPVPLPVTIAKHRVLALGPDVTIPIASRSRLLALVNARYLWETGARIKTQGQSLLITATVPVPSIRVPPQGR
jgi:hypothetical protein